jgi:hypothetical protein
MILCLAEPYNCIGKRRNILRGKLSDALLFSRADEKAMKFFHEQMKIFINHMKFFTKAVKFS